MRPVRRADNLPTFMCRSSWNLGTSTSWNPRGLPRPVMGLLYLFGPLTCEASIQIRYIIIIIFINCNWVITRWQCLLYIWSRMCRHCRQPMLTLTTTCWFAKMCTRLKNVFQKGKPRCNSQKLLLNNRKCKTVCLSTQYKNFCQEVTEKIFPRCDKRVICVDYSVEKWGNGVAVKSEQWLQSEERIQNIRIVNLFSNRLS